MDLGICLRNRMPVRTIMELARHAEDRGFHSVWITEGLGYKDVVTQMAAVATATKRIGIASGIIPIRTRTPLLLGNTFIALDELSGGRAILGVGSGHPGPLQDFHGIRIERPVAFMRDYLSVIRLLYERESFSYEGRTFNVAPYERGFAPPSPRLPIYIAALNPGMLGLAGELADGVIMNLVTPPYLAEAQGIIAERARRAGRDPGQIKLGSYVLCSLSDNETEALEVIRDMIAHYARDPFYEAMLRRAGFGDTLDEMADPLERGDLARAAAMIPEAMASALTMYGSKDRCQATLDGLAQAGLQLAVLHPQMPKGTDHLKAIGELIDAFADAHHGGAK